MTEKPLSRVLTAIFTPTFTLGCVGLIGLLITLGIFYEARFEALERLQTEFKNDTMTQAMIIQDTFKEALMDLDAVKRFYDGSESVEREEFTQFVLPVTLHRRGIKSFGWVPSVPRDKRAQFEEAARKDGVSGYQFKSLNSAGQLVREPEKEVYYPIFYVEPMEKNLPVLGFDYGSDPVSLKTLERAKDVGEIIASQRLNLVQATDYPYGILVLAPVYTRGMTTNNLAERRAAFMGAASLLIWPGEIVRAAIQYMPPQDFYGELVDTSAPPETQLLCRWGYSVSAQPMEATIQHPPGTTLFFSHKFEFAGQHFKVNLKPNASFLADHYRYSYRLILPVGVVLTALLSLYLHGLMTRRALAEAQVAERTRELQSTEKRYHSLFSSMQEGFALHEVIHDAEGKGVDYRYLDVNPAFERNTGISREKWIGHTVREVIPGIEPYWIETFCQVALTGQSRQIEDYVKELDRYYEVMAYSPERGQFAVIMLDVSLRKRAASERERLLKELELKNKELESLVYVASHDLRSPLVNIQGFGQRMEKYCVELSRLLSASTVPEELRQTVLPLLKERIPGALGYIHAGADKMDSLISGLLRLSRTGRMALRAEKVAMRPMMDAIIASMSYQIQKAEASIEIESLPDCMADPQQMNQVFSNLLDNALKYRDTQRPLHISIVGHKEAGKVIYSIGDNGRGMALEQMEKIWELFYRLDPRGDVPGEGLGLTLARRIVERHQGRIWVESEPGKGSCFFVELPTQMAPVPS